MAPTRLTGWLQCWPAAFAQVATVSWMVFVVELFGSVRHRPVALFTYSALDWRVHTSPVVLEQGSMNTSTVPPLTHWPNIWSCPLAANVSRCDVPPLQLYRSILLPPVVRPK